MNIQPIRKRRIVVLNNDLTLDGRIIRKFGKAGKGLGEFSTVHEIDCRNPDQLFVSEISAWRAQKILLTPSRMQPATSSAAGSSRDRRCRPSRSMRTRAR